MTAGRQAITDTKDWCTPPKIVRAVKWVFGGHIALDPCSNQHSIVGAETEFSLPETNGLAMSWDYATIYMNPPYGSDRSTGTTIKHWFAKLADAHTKFGAECIALVPVATNTDHWKRFVYPVASAICFLYDTRLKFHIDGFEDPKGAPMSCACIYYGTEPSRFADAFDELGAVVYLDGIRLPQQHQLTLLTA